uniref:Polysaccharide biosynthesis protein n=1 Tax=Sphingobacterium sp. (strain 21) TaxID=743722 RepID=F4C954_SPHS2
MIKKLFSHTAIYGLAPQITRIASVFALPIITQYLTDIDFGVYGVVTAVSGAIAVLNSLGLRVILTNSFYKSPYQYRWAWRQIYGFLMLWNLPYSIILSCILWFFIPKEAYDHRFSILLLNVMPIIFFGPTAVIGTTLYQLKQQPAKIALRTAFFGIMTVILNIYFIAVLKQGYMGWFISTAITTMMSQMSYFVPLNFVEGLKPIFNFKRRFIKHSLKVALPTVPHFYASYLLDSSDRIVMRVMNVSTANIGLYNAAYTIGNLFRQLGTAAGFAIGPMMNAAYKNKDERTARNLVFVLQIMFFVLTFTSAIWLKEIFHILLKNPSLQNTYQLGIIILMGYNYRPMYIGASNKLFYVEKTKVLLKVTFVAGLVSVILNFAFIPFFGYKIAAYTTFIALMYMGYAGYFLSVFEENNKEQYYPLLWLSLTIFLTILAYYVVDLNFFVKISINLVVSVLCFLLVRNFSNRPRYE